MFVEPLTLPSIRDSFTPKSARSDLTSGSGSPAIKNSRFENNMVDRNYTLKSTSNESVHSGATGNSNGSYLSCSHVYQPSSPYLKGYSGRKFKISDISIEHVREPQILGYSGHFTGRVDGISAVEYSKQRKSQSNLENYNWISTSPAVSPRSPNSSHLKKYRLNRMPSSSDLKKESEHFMQIAMEIRKKVDQKYSKVNEARSKLKNAFTRHDVNKEGYCFESQFITGLNMIGLEMNSEDLHCIFNNLRGTNGEISHAKFLDLIAPDLKHLHLSRTNQQQTYVKV